MSTKVSAQVKAVLRDGDETAIVLVLAGKNTVSLEKNDKVYLEMTNALNGDKVEFFPAPEPVAQAEEEELPIEGAPQVEELDLTPVVEPVAPVVEEPQPPVENEVAPPADSPEPAAPPAEEEKTQ